MTPGMWVAVTAISVGVSAVASIVSATAVWFGYRAVKVSQDALDVSRASLTLTKESLAADKQRQRIVTAIEINERFNREFVPAFRDLQVAYQLEKESFVSSAAVAFRVTDTPADYGKTLGNSLESWALFVVHDVADDSLLFKVAGRPYCEMVDKLATYAGITRSEAMVRWGPVYDLRNRWEPKIGSLLEEVSEASKRLHGSDALSIRGKKE